jgi:glutamine amidotransferase
MCELFGMSGRYATDVVRSLTDFQPRGGDTGPHADGWGVAWYEGRAAAVIKESTPAAASQCFQTLTHRQIQSAQFIAHIRRANPPEVGRAWANTHPFERELNGRSWVFAHNGKLKGIASDPRFALHRFRPLGDTDSEHAFCFLLDRLAEWRDLALEPPWTELAGRLRGPISQLSALGEFNFLLGNGSLLLAHAHTHLTSLRRTCHQSGCSQVVTLVATSALTDEAWQSLTPGSLHLLVDGEAVAVGAQPRASM